MGWQKQRVGWFGSVLRKDDDLVLRVALNLEAGGKIKQGQPKNTWKKQVKTDRKDCFGMEEDAMNQALRRDGVQTTAEERVYIQLIL